MRADGRAVVAVRYLLLVVVGVCLALPLVWALAGAVKPLEEIYATPPQVLTEHPQWSNFLDAMRRLPFLRFMINSLLIALPAVCGAVLTSAMAGYAFARLQWRGRRWWFLVLLASLVVPAQVLLVPHFLLFSALGWVNTFKPLIVPAWLGGGAFNIFLFCQFFRTIPREFSDAALVDGASQWMVFTRIMLPLAKPAVATVALLSFVYHWQDFIRPLIYLSDFRTYPVALGLRMYQSTDGSWMNLVLAASLVALVPVAVVFFFLQKHLRSGLTPGAKTAPRMP